VASFFDDFEVYEPITAHRLVILQSELALAIF
jgi:hypothetical protein